MEIAVSAVHKGTTIRRAADHRPRPGVPILMYHQVAPLAPAAFGKYSVTPRAFAAQMRWLAMAGYTPVDLDALLSHRGSGAPLPRRPIVITFDDGFQECADHAAPILQSFGFTATFYLVAGLMGQPSRWLLGERGVEFPLMDWNTARKLYSAGFTCGAHTVTHPRLAQLPAAACREELRRSREMIEERLGCEVAHLAYPFGSYDERVREIAAETGYRSACSVQIGISASDDDPLALHRVPVSGYDTLTDFICRLRTARPAGELLRGKARGAWRHVRRLAGRAA
jgi:peptidoglycan/xylan/chitin deacetylase (PgdA/CDA1 family)